MIAYTFYDLDYRVIRYAEALAHRGDEVDVVALRRGAQASYEFVNGVKVFRIQARVVNEKGRFSYLMRLLLFFLRATVFVTWNHVRAPYDLVHVHSVPDFLVFTAFWLKLTGAKLILDIHDLLPEFYASKFDSKRESLSYKLLVVVERASAAFADHVIIANDLWKNKLLCRSVSHGKCTALINFPDRSLFDRKRRSRNDTKFIVLYPGTLNWHQGLDIAIRAFARIRDLVPHVQLHIYGEGSAKVSLITLVEHLGLRDRVFFKPVLPLREIATVMANADLGIVPKRKNSFGNEAFSTKTLEFMSVGVPVIVSDTRVDQYYFNQSVVQFFRGGDENDLADQMLRLICSPEVRDRLVQNASEFVRQYDWSRRKGIYLGLVDSLTRDRASLQ